MDDTKSFWQNVKSRKLGRFRLCSPARLVKYDREDRLPWADEGFELLPLAVE